MEVNHTQRLIDYLDVVKTPHAGAAEQSKLQKDFKEQYGDVDININDGTIKERQDEQANS